MNLRPADVLLAYQHGVFPMAEAHGSNDVFFVDPDVRAHLPLAGLKVSKSLAKIMRSGVFEARTDTQFNAVMRACAGLPTSHEKSALIEEREETWINSQILEVYGQLHDMGHAHSVECWQDNVLVGGLYGVSLGRAFFGESMFSYVSNASKIALVHLVDILRSRGFVLLDVQFMTAHLRSLGCEEINREDFHKRLRAALRIQERFW